MILLFIGAATGIIIGVFTSRESDIKFGFFFGGVIGLVVGTLTAMLVGLGCPKDYYTFNKTNLCPVQDNNYLTTTNDGSSVKYMYSLYKDGGCQLVTADDTVNYVIIRHIQINKPYVNYTKDKNKGIYSVLGFNGMAADIVEFHIPASNVIKEYEVMGTK